MKLIKFLFGVIVILVIGSVTLTNRSVDEGVVVASLSHEISALQNDNAILAAEVASLGAIGNLRTKLAQEGYVESGKVASVSVVSSVASR